MLIIVSINRLINPETLHSPVDAGAGQDTVRSREPQQVHGYRQDGVHRHIQLVRRLLRGYCRSRVRVRTSRYEQY